MSEERVIEIAESFINGNISWCREQLGGSRKKIAQVAAWLREYVPDELESFLRLMSE